ncbi:tetratricopeptide repeat-containing sensor histidine kinase, partial [Fulvivirga kasyanovii]
FITYLLYACSLCSQVQAQADSFPSFFYEIKAKSDAGIISYFDSLRNNPSDQAEILQKSLLSYAEEEELYLVELLCNRNLGKIYSNNKEHSLAIAHLSRAAELAASWPDPSLHGDILVSMSGIYDALGKKDDALEKLLRAYEILIKADSLEAAQVQYAMANLNYGSGNLREALRYGFTAKKIYDRFKMDELQTKYQYNLMHLLNTIGVTYRELKEYDSAIYYLDSSREIALHLNNEFWINLTIGNIGSVYMLKGEYEKAIAYLRQDLRASKKFKEWISAANSAMSIGQAYSKLGNNELAKVYYDSALYVFGNKASNTDILRTHYYRNLSLWYASKKEFENALIYQQRYMALKDTLMGRKQQVELAQVKANYDFDRKLKEIDLLTKNNQLQQQRIDYRNIIILAGAAAICIILIVTALLYINLNARKRDNALLAEQKERIESQSEQLAEQNRVIQVINDNLEQEVEKRTQSLKSLNKELDIFLYHASHDIRQPIATILGLENLARKYTTDPDLTDILERLKSTADRMDNMLRKLQISHSVNHTPARLEEVDLQELTLKVIELNKETEKRRAATLCIDIEKRVINSNSELLAVVIHNIIENALTYGNERPLEVNIDGKQLNEEYCMTISDNGEGIPREFQPSVFNAFFKASAQSKGNGLGLYLAWKASTILGIKIELKSELNKGSEFTLHIPTV